jgi:subtilisin
MSSKIVRLPEHELETCSRLISKASLLNQGQQRDWGHVLLEIDQCWKEFSVTGQGINVAVLDTGVDTTHRDLSVKGGIDFTGSRYSYNDIQNHGTHCSGIICAKGNDIGVVGVAPDSNLFAVKVLDDTGSGEIDNITRGIHWCVENNIHIISMSLGGDGELDSKLKEAIDRAIASGCIIICAAGNSGDNNVSNPANYHPVICVGAIDKDRRLAEFSSKGATLDTVAPGVGILSCVTGNRYARMSGTSMATPYVAGVASLYYQLMSKLGFTPSQGHFEELVRRTSIDLGSKGHDHLYGWGLINPKHLLLEAMKKGEPNIPPNPPPQQSKYLTVYLETSKGKFRFDDVIAVTTTPNVSI